MCAPHTNTLQHSGHLCSLFSVLFLLSVPVCLAAMMDGVCLPLLMFLATFLWVLPAFSLKVCLTFENMLQTWDTVQSGPSVPKTQAVATLPGKRHHCTKVWIVWLILWLILLCHVGFMLCMCEETKCHFSGYKILHLFSVVISKYLLIS